MRSISYKWLLLTNFEPHLAHSSLNDVTTKNISMLLIFMTYSFGSILIYSSASETILDNTYSYHYFVKAQCAWYYIKMMLIHILKLDYFIYQIKVLNDCFMPSHIVYLKIRPTIHIPNQGLYPYILKGWFVKVEQKLNKLQEASC